MRDHGVKNLVFSSSATVYGKPESVPIREDFPLSTTNPYGSTKLMIENILTDVTVANPKLSVSLPYSSAVLPAYYNSFLPPPSNGYDTNAYCDYKERILYPFGYGLSYTDFNIKILNAQLCDDTVKIGVKITNTDFSVSLKTANTHSTSSCLTRT